MGSEMCIRDRCDGALSRDWSAQTWYNPEKVNQRNASSDIGMEDQHTCRLVICIGDDLVDDQVPSTLWLYKILVDVI